MAASGLSVTEWEERNFRHVQHAVRETAKWQMFRVFKSNWNTANTATPWAGDAGSGSALLAKYGQHLEKVFHDQVTLNRIVSGDVQRITVSAMHELLNLPSFLQAAPTAKLLGIKLKGDEDKVIAQAKRRLQSVVSYLRDLPRQAHYLGAGAHPNRIPKKHITQEWERVSELLQGLGVGEDRINEVKSADFKVPPGPRVPNTAGAGVGVGAGSKAGATAAKPASPVTGARQLLLPPSCPDLRITQTSKGSFVDGQWQEDATQQVFVFTGNSALNVSVGASESVEVSFPRVAVKRMPLRSHHVSIRWNFAQNQFVVDNVSQEQVSTFVKVTAQTPLKEWSWVMVGDVLGPNSAGKMAAASFRLVRNVRGGFLVVRAPPLNTVHAVVNGTQLRRKDSGELALVGPGATSGALTCTFVVDGDNVAVVPAGKDTVHVILSPNEQLALPRGGATELRLGHMNALWGIRVESRPAKAAAKPKARASTAGKVAKKAATAAKPAAAKPATGKPAAAKPATTAAKPPPAPKEPSLVAAVVASNSGAVESKSSDAAPRGAWGAPAPAPIVRKRTSRPRTSSVASTASQKSQKSTGSAGKQQKPRRRERAPKITKRMELPVKCRGAIIGVRGETIKGLESTHGTSIKLQDQAELIGKPVSSMSHLTIEGRTQEAVDAAFTAIEAVIAAEKERQQKLRDSRPKHERRNRNRGDRGDRGDRDSSQRRDRGKRDSRERPQNGHRRSRSGSDTKPPPAAPAPATAAAPAPAVASAAVPTPDLASMGEFPSLG